MRAKDTCPSCGAKVSPDDLLCANCELILDANLIPDKPSNGDFSVVRRMLEVPQPGLPSARPAKPPAPPATKGNEGPTRVFALGRTRGIPMVVASLTKRAAALSELEAFVVSFIDGESDLDTLAERAGLRSFELGVVLQALNDKMIVDFADESLQEEEDEAEAPVAEEPPTAALPTVSQEPRSAPTVLMKPIDPAQLVAPQPGSPPTVRMEPIVAPQPGPPPTVRMEPIGAPPPGPPPTIRMEPVRLEPEQLQAAAETGDFTPPEAAPVALEEPPTPAPLVDAASNPAPTPPPPAPLPPPVEGRRRSMKLRPSLPGPPPGEKPPPPVPTPPAPGEARAPAATPPAPATPPSAAPPPPPQTPPPAAVRPPAIAPVPPVSARRTSELRPEPVRSGVETRQEPAVAPIRSNVETRQEPAVEVPAVTQAESGAGVILDAALDEEAGRQRPSSSWVLTSVTASTRPELRVEASIIVAPHATPPEAPEVPPAAPPPPSRPRRTLPAGARSTGARPAPPLKLDAQAQTPLSTPVQSKPVSPAPKPMPPKTQPVVFEPEPEQPHESTDPRIVNRGRVNRKVLDALKQVKRRDTAPEVSSSEPSVDEILADKLAAGSLQVAIRMEQNGRLDEAIRYLENSIAKSPDAPSLYNRLAIILMRERADLRRAEQLLQKAAELAPGHEVYEKNLAAVLAKRAMKK